MKAVGFYQSLPIADEKSLVDIELEKPKAKGHDLLVHVAAISANPVDVKVRLGRRGATSSEANQPTILGWDAVGVVVDTGDLVTLFKSGDQVFYAGDVRRAGSNSEFQLVDERIVAHAPKSLGNAQAAALPLTSITAWEILFDRLEIQVPSKKHPKPVLLVVGAAGGVGSILVQLARQLTQVTIIATASRPETQAWVSQLGAHHVIDHTQALDVQLTALGFNHVTHVASLTHTNQHFEQLVKVIAPQGKLAIIDELTKDIMPLKAKSVSIHWESMFTRSSFETVDMLEQHHILSQIVKLIDEGKLKTTLGKHLGSINAVNLKQAHALLESGKSIGKIVLEGF